MSEEHSHSKRRDKQDQCNTQQGIKPSKKPSYLNISCQVSGYSSFCCYKADKMAFKPERSPGTGLPPIQVESDTSTTSYVTASESFGRLSTTSFTKVNGVHSSKSQDDLIDSRMSPSNKSLVQRRIEKLYGSNAANVSPSKKTPYYPTMEILCDRTLSDSPGPFNGHCVKSKSTEMCVSSKDFLCRGVAQVEKLNGHSIGDTASIVNQLEDTKDLSNCEDEVDRIQITTSAIEINGVNGVCSLGLKNGNYYLKMMEVERVRIEERIGLTEKDEKEGCVWSEEVSGVVRTAVGKARLLLTKKFKQFAELCYKNLSVPEEGEFATTDQDLSGFWDLVLIQVDQVHRTFDTIDQIRNNGWKVPEQRQKDLLYQSPSHTPTVKTSPFCRRTPGVTSPSKRTPGALRPSPGTPATTASGKAREEARRQLREAKLKAKQNMKGPNGDGGKTADFVQMYE